MLSHEHNSHTNCCGEIFPVTNDLQWNLYAFHLAPNSIQKCLSLWSGLSEFIMHMHYAWIAYFSGKITKGLDPEYVQEMLQNHRMGKAGREVLQSKPCA